MGAAGASGTRDITIHYLGEKPCVRNERSLRVAQGVNKGINTEGFMTSRCRTRAFTRLGLELTLVRKKLKYSKSRNSKDNDDNKRGNGLVQGMILHVKIEGG